MTTEITIETFPEPKPPKARGRKSIAKKESPASKLIDALKFISIAQKKTGNIRQQYCVFAGGWLCASDGILTVGVPVEAAIDACPQTATLVEALGKVEAEFSVVQLPENALAVTSGVFRAIVQCESRDNVPIPAPDAPCAAVSDDLKLALLAVAPAAADSDASAWANSVLLQAYTVVGTNRYVILEAYHGIDLPPGILMPKPSALHVGKCKKALKQFGFSESSATFWFEDGSFIKTQLHKSEFPDYRSRLFGDFDMLDFEPLPPEFFKAVKSVKGFAKADAVWFKGGGVYSAQDEEIASSYKMDLLPDGMIFDPKLLLLCEKYMNEVKFHYVHDLARVTFKSAAVRGIAMGRGISSEV